MRYCIKWERFVSIVNLMLNACTGKPEFIRARFCSTGKWGRLKVSLRWCTIFQCCQSAWGRASMKTPFISSSFVVSHLLLRISLKNTGSRFSVQNSILALPALFSSNRHTLGATYFIILNWPDHTLLVSLFTVQEKSQTIQHWFEGSKFLL